MDSTTHPAEGAPATYAELATRTRDLTHEAWEPTLGDSYDSLHYQPSEEPHANA